METFIVNNDLKMKYLNFDTESDKQKFLHKLYLESIIKIRQVNEEKNIIKNENQNYMSDLDSDEL